VLPAGQYQRQEDAVRFAVPVLGALVVLAATAVGVAVVVGV
jgi:hypothetical protein